MARIQLFAERLKCLDAAEIITVSSLLPALLSTGCTFAHFYSCKVLNADSRSLLTTNIFFRSARRPKTAPPHYCTCTHFSDVTALFEVNSPYTGIARPPRNACFFFSPSLLHALIMPSMQNRLVLRLHWVAEADRGFLAHVIFVWQERH